MASNNFKRNLVPYSSCDVVQPTRKEFVEKSTNTDCNQPMGVDMSTQTCEEDFKYDYDYQEISFDELKNRIANLEQKFESWNTNDKPESSKSSIVDEENKQIIAEAETTMQELIVHEENNEIITEEGTLMEEVIEHEEIIVNEEPSMEEVTTHERIQQYRPVKQTNYQIITSKGVEYIEPVEIVYEDERTYGDLNTSNNSHRLRICTPNDEQAQQQEEQNYLQYDMLVPTSQVSSVLQTPISSPIEQPSYIVPMVTAPLPSKELTEIIKTYLGTSNHTSLPQRRQSPPNLTPASAVRQRTESPPNPAPARAVRQRTESPPNPVSVRAVRQRTEFPPNPEPVSAVRRRTESPSNAEPASAVRSLGPNNTTIPAVVYDSMDWNSPTAATRKLLISIFNRETLATHTMTGKPSPAFKGRNMPIKQQLDARIVSDIIYIVSRKCGVPEKDVRNAITTKCADENKMFKQREKKRKSLVEANKENVVKTVSPAERN